MSHQTLHSKLREITSKFPHNTVLKMEDKSINFQQLDDFSTYTAYYLFSKGLRPGDKVSLWMSNSIEWVIIFFALSKLGAINVPINTRLRYHDANYLIEQSESSALIISAHPAA